MLTTLYVIVSLLYYFFNDYPLHKHFEDNEEIYAYNINKSFLKLEKIMFYIARANMIVCIVLIFLKCIGVIEWW